MADDSLYRPCRNGCGFTGTVETGYYCSRCYRERTGSSAVPREVVPMDTAQNLPPVGTQPPAEEAKICSSCRDFFGSEEYGGLCHSCFMKKTQHQSSQDSQLCTKCQKYFGSEEFGGICNKCFMALTVEDTQGPARGGHTTQEPVLQQSTDRYPPPHVQGREDRSQGFNLHLVNDPEPYQGMPPAVYIPPDLPRPAQHGANVSQHRPLNPSPVRDYGRQSPISPVNIPPQGPADHPQQSHYPQQLPSTSPEGSHWPIPMTEGSRCPVNEGNRRPVTEGSQRPIPKPRRDRSMSNKQPNVTGGGGGPMESYSSQQRPPPDPLSNRSCFVCDPDQPIQLLNVVCQQHAKHIRRAMYNGSSNGGNKDHYNPPVTPEQRLPTKQPAFTSPQFTLTSTNEHRGHLGGGGGSATGYHGNPSVAPPMQTRGPPDVPDSAFGSTQQRTEPVRAKPRAGSFCCNIGCSNMQTDDLGGFCTDCYQIMVQHSDRRRRESDDRDEVGGAGPIGASQHQSQSPPKPKDPPAKMLCGTPGCSFYPLPELNGFCKDCYASKERKQ